MPSRISVIREIVVDERSSLELSRFIVVGIVSGASLIASNVNPINNPKHTHFLFKTKYIEVTRSKEI
jgi:hypothetical protein